MGRESNHYMRLRNANVSVAAPKQLQALTSSFLLPKMLSLSTKSTGPVP